MDIRYGALIILFLVLNYVVSSVRWKKLLVHANTEKVTLGYLTSLYFIGAFFNNFMPTSIGGDVYKIVKLGNKIGSKADAFSATFMERFTGMIALVFISLFGFIVTFLKGTGSNEFVLIGSVVLILFVVFGVSGFVGLKTLEIAKKKIAKLEKIYNSLMQYKGQNQVLFVAFLTSFIVQFLSIFTQYFIFVAIGVKLDIFKSLFIFPVITLASFFIPSLNGIGVQDFLYKFSNIFLAINAPAAVASSILYHLFRLIVSLFGGVLYALGKDE